LFPRIVSLIHSKDRKAEEDLLSTYLMIMQLKRLVANYRRDNLTCRNGQWTNLFVNRLKIF